MTNANDSEPGSVKNAIQPPPTHFAWSTNIIPILAAFTVVGVFWLAQLSEHGDIRITYTFEMCRKRLWEINSAKVDWAIEHGKTKDDAPTLEDLRSYFFGFGTNLPSCPDGGRYTPGKMDEKPKCSLGGRHSL